MGFGDSTSAFQRVTSTPGLVWECGEYTLSTDATCLIPTTLSTVVFGIAVADGSTVGVCPPGRVEQDTLDFSIHGGTGDFNAKVVHYIAAGW